MRLESDQKQVYYVVKLDALEVSRHFDLASAMKMVEEFKCVHPGAVILMETYRAGRLITIEIPTPNPVDAVLSVWGGWIGMAAWSACVNNVQTRPEQQTRTIVTPAANGGIVPGALVNLRTESRACVVDEPGPGDPIDCVLDVWGGWIPAGDWSECLNGARTRAIQRSKTILVQPANGGVACGANIETDIEEEACSLTESPSGWRVPDDGTQIVDAALDTWKIEPVTNNVLKNDTVLPTNPMTATTLLYLIFE